MDVSLLIPRELRVMLCELLVCTLFAMMALEYIRCLKFTSSLLALVLEASLFE